jgi:hypothetical protein
MSSPLDFAFRTIESIAFSLHAILGITEPFTGCLRGAFKDNLNMVWWGWPVAGCVLAFCAFSNFKFADNDKILLAVQWYIVTFHFGAIWYHIRLLHHPAVGVAPGIFIPIALTVIALRLQEGSWWYILPLGTIACATVAYFLCRLLVTAPSSSGDTDSPEQTLLPQASSRRQMS